MSKKVAVVTGAGSGIGQAIAEKLSGTFDVILVDINDDNLTATAKKISSAGNKSVSVVGNVGSRETHQSARKIAEKNGELVAWVNCAGVTRGAPLHDYPDDPYYLENIIHINQIGTFWGCSEAVTSFLDNKRSGSIVNISSVHGRHAWPEFSVYEMTKSAIDALTRNIAVSYGAFGIRANSIAPGAINTPALVESIANDKDPTARQKSLESLTPANRIGDPSEIANVAMFLLTSSSSFISGASIAVDGGWTSALGIFKPSKELADKYGLDPETGLSKDWNNG